MISRRARSIKESGIRRIFELMADVDDPINLSIGQAHFDVPDPVKDAAVAAIREGFNRYTVTQGIPDLNTAILQRLAHRYGYEGQHSLVTSGVSGGLLLGFLALLDSGDEVLLPDPYFTMYAVLAGMCNATFRTYDLYPGTALTESALERQVGDRTRAILVNSPSNPTGRTLTSTEMEAVATVARRRDLVVVSDEIYDEFVYDTGHVSSIGRVDSDRLLVLGGFSKTYGMPGWRLGWACGPAELVDAMRRMQQFSFVCAPSMVQKAGLAAMGVDMSAQIGAYRHKRDLVHGGLEGHYDVSLPGGSFYMFPRLPPGVDGDTFLGLALERKLLVVPGHAFSAQDTHFRLSFAAPDDVLKRGIEALVDLAEACRQG